MLCVEIRIKVQAGPDRRHRRKIAELRKSTSNYVNKYHVRCATSERRRQDKKVQVKWDMALARVAKGAYISVRQPAATELEDVDKLLASGKGYRTLKWGGKYVLCIFVAQTRSEYLTQKNCALDR